MKSLMIAMMITGMNLCVMGQTGDEVKKDSIWTGYKYTDDDDRTYEWSAIGSEYLLHIDDPKAKVEGYCMMDHTTLQQLRDLLRQTTLTTVKENYINKDVSDKAKTWMARFLTTWGDGDNDHQYLSHRGYIDPTTIADAEAMRRTADLLDAINRLLRQRLTDQQSTYGFQQLACMEHSESGHMYIFYTEDGRSISPKAESFYFNFGNYCVAENSRNTPEQVTERQQYDRTMADRVGVTIKVVRYKKPKQEILLSDAPSSRYTFYFFDGRCISYDSNYMENYNGKWIVENDYTLRLLLDGRKK